ncbi:hypothetical protein PC116_g1253 [Phytophthora cactorum]|uniref:Uncharacterized protein n=1 Tax=Phytophthora cactorum TaxID=29920 RepID=A0A8T1EM31_9STRA|nr:hypothetical protein PC114_g1545 [Phytophthora cactorum]KAG2954622.1 hypothetical protein PC117_g1056 [Phytophthora cactorum]KAG2972190.1 hypothetical protein PC120_g26340 [Phytophthora cactorum]KAG3037282.1 hypothetical protein PC119_g3781 [Phytophthora cactorum]KAG3179585.1 hypothetical protein C6341_g7442 [Phytophthora cactorum]
MSNVTNVSGETNNAIAQAMAAYRHFDWYGRTTLQ